MTPRPHEDGRPSLLFLSSCCVTQDLYTEDDEWAHMGGYQPSPSVAPSVPDTVNQSVRFPSSIAMELHCTGQLRLSDSVPAALHGCPAM